MKEESFCDGILENINIIEKETNNEESIFSHKKIWNVGDEIEAKDFMKKWYRARIMARHKKHGGRILVHFQGWNTQYDEWLPVDSDRIRLLNKPNKESLNDSPKISIGAIIYAPWRDGRLYPGKIIHSTKQSCFIRFYDGMCRKVKNKLIFNMNDKEKSDYLREGYFNCSSSKIENENNCKELNKSNIRINKLLLKKSKFKHGRHKLRLSSKFLKRKVLESDNFADGMNTSLQPINSLTEHISNLTNSKASKKCKKKLETIIDSGPKARCSFCQKNQDRFVTRPSLNAMKQCYVCVDCTQEYDERLKAHHLQAINDWLITGKLPSFQMESQECKGKRKDDVTNKSSDEVIMKATNDVIADLTKIQKTLSYIDQVILLLNDEKNTATLYASLIKTSPQLLNNNPGTLINNSNRSISFESAYSAGNLSQWQADKPSTNSLTSSPNPSGSVNRLNISNASETKEAALNERLDSRESVPENSSFSRAYFPVAALSSPIKTPVDSSPEKRAEAARKHADFGRLIKSELARMQAELARKILSIESTVGVLEIGSDHKTAIDRQQFQNTLDEINDFALITNLL